jgi:hypothetical protein
VDALQPTDSQDLTSTPFDACISACTSKAENANADALEAGHQSEGEGTAAADQGDTLAKLAAALLTLSPADRERLAAMLTTGNRQASGP